MNGCSGACCAAFTLTPDLEECEVEGGTRRVDDEAYIADMVVPISVGEALARKVAFGGSVDEGLGGKQWYRCRHWDEGTRLCREYGSRPAMCRDYPYLRGGGCEHGCSCVGRSARACGVYPQGDASGRGTPVLPGYGERTDPRVMLRVVGHVMWACDRSVSREGNATLRG